uniref:Glucosylceramidase n=1 Tax=Timema monikensis TaxID=170555 RepID=A0A7R9E0Y6_9NEOP|nr:unnamed protein product [Timema monikensis]
MALNDPNCPTTGGTRTTSIATGTVCNNRLVWSLVQSMAVSQSASTRNLQPPRSHPPVYEKATKIFVWNCALHSASNVVFDCCAHAHIGGGGEEGETASIFLPNSTIYHIINKKTAYILNDTTLGLSRIDQETPRSEGMDRAETLDISATPVVVLFSVSVQGESCLVRDYGASSVVCVCNSTHCDSLQPISEEDISNRSFTRFTSSKDGQRFKRTTDVFVDAVVGSGIAEFYLNKSQIYQDIIGFGGAMTDASAINIASFSEKTSDNLMRSYFGEGGSQYTIIRNPMGASDFSVEYYTYDDVDGDTELNEFSLREEDYKYKIPLLKRAKELNPREVKLFTSPWSAPYWMKRNGTTSGTSHLLEENYQPWANYFVKYVY